MFEKLSRITEQTFDGTEQFGRIFSLHESFEKPLAALLTVRYDIVVNLKKYNASKGALSI